MITDINKTVEEVGTKAWLKEIGMQTLEAALRRANGGGAMYGMGIVECERRIP